MGQSFEQASVQHGSLLSGQTRLPVETVVFSHFHSTYDNITASRRKMFQKTKYESRKLFVGPTLDDNTPPQKPLVRFFLNQKQERKKCNVSFRVVIFLWSGLFSGY